MVDAVCAVLAALASALAQAFGTVLRHRSADQGDAGAVAALGALRQPRWWSGTLVSLLGFVFQGVGLHFGSLLLVQPLTVLSLMFALPIDARMRGRRVATSDWVWGTVLTVTAGVIVVVGRPVGGVDHVSGAEWLVACAAGVAAVAGLIALGRRYSVRLRGGRGAKAMLLGISGGTAFAYVALFTKATVTQAADHGPASVLLSWQLLGLVVSGAVALTVQQASFGAGAVTQAVPASTVTTPIVSLALGLGLLHERFSTGGLGLVVLALTVVAMAVATVRLAADENRPPRPRRRRVR